EVFLAEGTADHRDRSGSGAIVVGNDEPSPGGLNGKALEIISRYQFAAGDLSLAVDRHVHASDFPGVAIGEYIGENCVVVLGCKVLEKFEGRIGENAAGRSLAGI